MSARVSLKQKLEGWIGGTTGRQDVARTILALAETGARLSELLAQGEPTGDFGRPTGKVSSTDEQKVLDVLASEWLGAALKTCPVALFLDEESEAPRILNAGAPLIVAADPIDGSSNIEANSAIGTIFSILPTCGRGDAREFLQPGHNQLAAGFLVYGPQTTLALTFGDGTQLYTLDRASRDFVLTKDKAAIAPNAREFAINASNYRHWDESTKAWLDECLQGTEGPREQDYNMRWTASPVAEFYRILIRGGVFLYPGDRRRGYTQGRLRLIYEASPFAMLMEQAGGAATDGERRILDIEPDRLHQHVPVVAGARNEVAHIARLNESPHASGLRSPLFLRRGLMRA